MNLDKRLLLCANFVKKGSRVVDVGSDHAYLVIWLVLKGLVPSAIAADVRNGPLSNAQKNIGKYGLKGKILTRLSDGLDKITSDEVDEIVMAGLGGKLIIDIIKKTPWLNDRSKHLILQPMSAEQELREFLRDEGFTEVEEKAVVSHGKIYTVMSVFYDSEEKEFDDVYPYIGLLNRNIFTDNCAYIKREIRNLKNKMKGFLATNNLEKVKHLSYIINKLEKIIAEE